MTTAPQSKTMVLVDGHALAYRMYFALERTQMRDKEDRPTWAPYGFFNAIFQLLAERQPDAMVFAFDVSRESFRTRQYPEYKANRASMPDDMRTQMDIIYEGIRALGLPVFRVPDVEADDVIGTLSAKMVQTHPDWHVDILTGDQDSFQLVDRESRINILIPSRNAREGLSVYDWDAVIGKWGVTPDQVIDFKGLKGDTSDNIPGVRGIGDKIAAKLLNTYPCLDDIYEHLDEIAPAGVQRKLREGEAIARLSRELATIVKNVPLEFDLQQACLDSSHANPIELAVFFQSYSFNTFYKRMPEWIKYLGMTPESSNTDVFSTTGQKHENPTTHFPEFTYETVCNEDAFLGVLDEIHQTKVVAFDVETTGLNVHAVELVGFSVSYGPALKPLSIETRNPAELKIIPATLPGLQVNTDAAIQLRNLYIPVAHQDILASQMTQKAALGFIRTILGDESITKIIHNVKYETNCARHWGIPVRGPVLDTMLMSYVLKPERKHGLKALGDSELNFSMQPIENLIGKGKTQITFAQVPVAQAASYGASDTYATWCLAYLFTQQMEKCPEQQSLFYEIENPLAPVLADMEWNGIRLDVPYLKECAQELTEGIESIEQEIQRYSSEPVNLNSPKQVGEFLFERLGINPLRKTATKSYSTDVSVLEALRNEHPVIEKLLQYRQLFKLKSTYVEPLPLQVKPQTGRLHTSFNQCIAVTGRLSSTDPNLQNIPVRNAWGNRIRQAFIPQEGWQLISADYSQIELRMVAHLSQDPALLNAFQEGRDIHTATAALVLGIPESSVTKEQRYAAKAVNFGIVYGQTSHGLSQQLGIPRSEAQSFIQKYFETYPGVKQFIERTVAKAHETGFGETLFGRKRNLKQDLASRNRNIREFAERASFNTPVQGAAAELLKLAMTELQCLLKESQCEARLLLQVHDELVLEAPSQEVSQVSQLIEQAMQLGQPLRVPLVVDIAIGQHWGEIG
jgi:DNA polymerase I